MAHVTFRYERDGEEYWGIWSTIVDNVLFCDMTEDEVVEYKKNRAAERAEANAVQTIEEIRNGDTSPLRRGPPESVVEHLENGEFEELDIDA